MEKENILGKVNDDMINFSDTNLSQNPEDTSTYQDEPDINILDNILPVDKLKNGWAFFSSLIVTKTIAAAEVVRDKSQEAYNSETFKNFSSSAAENYQKATEVTTTAVANASSNIAPIWEKTKNSLASVAEIVKEKTNEAAESAKPTFENVILEYMISIIHFIRLNIILFQMSQQAVAAGSFSWEKVLQVAELAQQEITKLAQPAQTSSPESPEYAPSVLDEAVKGGGVMTV